MRGVGASLVRVRRVAELLRPYRQRAVAATAAIALATLATLAPPYLAGRAIDDVINGGSTEQLDEIVLLMVGALVLGWLAVYAQTYLIEWVGQHALRDLRTRLFAHVQTLSISYFNHHSAGTLISRLTNNVETLDQLVTDGVIRARHERRHDRRRGRRPLRARPRARAGHDRRDPAARGGNVDLLPAIRAHLPHGARLDRHRHRRSGGVAVGARVVPLSPRSSATSARSMPSTHGTAR